MNIKTKWIIGASTITIATVGLFGLQACSNDSSSTTPDDSAGASNAGAPSSSAGASVSSAGAAISGAGDSSLAGSAGLTTAGAGGDTFGGSGGDTSGGSSGLGGDTSGGIGGASGSGGSGGAAAGSTTFTLQTSGTLGPVLATSTGMTLYVFGSDTASTTSPVSACTAGCLTTWPLYDGDPATVPAGVTASDFGTFSNGSATQSTYQGWPLYTYSGDTAAGQTNGNGVGTWHAVTIPFTAP